MPDTVNQPGPPPFDVAVADEGYQWWYLDAVSEDERHALVIILFVGSVFSPYYYRARQRGRGDPTEYCALNVALYGPGGRWAMTERRAGSVRRSADHFRIGPSTVHWDGARMVFELRERCAPFGQALRGRVVAEAGARCALAVDLDAAGRHRWTPWSPAGAVTVELEAPELSWRGSAYLDANQGTEPLERAFSTWDWSRSEAGEAQRLHYEVRDLAGAERLHCYDVRADGRYAEAEPAGIQGVRRTGWGLARAPRFGHGVGAVRGLEDTPFYSRTLFEGPGAGERTVHERLDMERFRRGWVRSLLPFRMPREWQPRHPPEGAD